MKLQHFLPLIILFAPTGPRLHAAPPQVSRRLCEPLFPTVCGSSLSATRWPLWSPWRRISWSAAMRRRRISGNGSCAGAHGVSRMRGDDGGSDRRHLCAARRRKQRRYAAEHHAVFRHCSGGRSRRCSQAQAACMHGIDDSQQEWAQERGAIEQEVARDLSNPTYKFIDRLNQDMFAGTPYAHDPLGTKSSFDATTGEMLKDFYDEVVHARQRHPGHRGRRGSRRDNGEDQAVVRRHSQPSSARAAGRRFEAGQVGDFHARQQSSLRARLHRLPLPGTDSPDYAASQILADVLASQRADLYGMVPAGKALAAEFGMAETYPKASVGYGAGGAACRSGRDRRHRRNAADSGPLCAEGRAGRSGGRGHSQRGCAGRVSSATPFPGWPTSGRMRWPPRVATLPMKTLTPSSGSRSPT